MSLSEFLEGTITNPIIVKELRATFRGRRFFATFLGVLCLFTVVLLGTVLFSLDPAQTISSQIGQSVFLVFLTFVFAVSVFVFPAFSCTAIVSEREKKTYEMLLVTGIRPWELVLGKFLACMCYVVTFISALIPLVFVSFLFGGVGLRELTAGIVATLGISSAITMVSLFISSLVPTARMAVMITYGPLLFAGTVGFCPCLCCGGSFVGGAISNFSGPAGFASGVLSQLGFLTPSLSSGEAFLFLVLAPATVWALFTGFFYLLTTNRMRPAWQNRSRPMRIFFLLFLAAGALQGAVDIGLGGAALAAVDLGDLLAWYWLGLGLCLALALSFTAESPILTYRMREELEQLEKRLSFRRLLFPGPGTGFALLIGGAAAAGVAAVLLLSGSGGAAGIGPAALAAAQVHALAPLLGWLVLLGGLGLFLGTFSTGETGRRWAVFGTGVVLAGLPFLAWPYQAFSGGPMASAGYFTISGFSFALSAFDLRFTVPALAGAGGGPGATAFAGHLLGTGIYAAVGVLLVLASVARRGVVAKRLAEVVKRDTTIVRRRRGPAAHGVSDEARQRILGPPEPPAEPKP